MIGTSDDPWAYDNERPEHEVTVAPFRIDTRPVTNRAYREFVEAGGYDDARLWDDAGWAWRQEAALVAPQFWRREAAARGRGGATGAPKISRSTNPCSTCAGTRPTRTPAGAARACRRKRNGRSPPRARRPSTPTSGDAGPHRFAPSDATRRIPTR